MFSELPQRCKENTKYSHLWSWNFDLFLLEKDLNWLINYQNNWELFVTPNSLQLLKHAELLLYCKWTVFWQPLKALYNTGHVDCRGRAIDPLDWWSHSHLTPLSQTAVGWTKQHIWGCPLWLWEMGMGTVFWKCIEKPIIWVIKETNC